MTRYRTTGGETIKSKTYYTPLFIAVTLIVWDQPRYLIMNEWIKKMLHIYSVKYDSVTKKIRCCSLQQYDWKWKLSDEICQAHKDVLSLFVGIERRSTGSTK